MAAHLIRRSFLGLLAVGLIAACVSPVANEGDGATLTRIFLVRHAEKEAGADPELTPAGEARAQALADRLSSEGVTEIWSTATRRTEQTARPLAEALGLPVATYDSSDLSAFAAQLTASPGVKLVVGHSNTTGELAAQIGADPGPPIDEAAEFDRMYIITRDDRLEVRSRIARYGAPSEGEETATP